MRTLLYKAKDEKSHKEIGQILRELPEGEYVIQLKKNRPIRSLNANKYYHAVVNIIALASGHDHDKLHEILKKKFNGEAVYFPKGGMEVVGKTTSDLDTKEFAAYVNRVKQWAQDEWDIVIPEPRDLDYAKWMAIEMEYSKVFSGF